MTARPARPPSLPVLAGAALLVLGACVPVQPVGASPEREDVTGVRADPGAVRAGGDLVVALSAEPDRLDPTTSSSLYTRYVMNAVCEKLYDVDADGELVPQLAAALPTTSADGLEVTIPVRQGVRFADGTPLDAAAVVTTLERNLTLETSSRKSELGPVSDVQALDPATVLVRYSRPFAPLTASLADRAGMVMSPTALAELGEDFGDRPTCVGPFKYVERVPQTSITVERDPNYYAADEVHLDSITYRIMTDANIRAANLRSGDVQVADSLSPQDVDALAQEDGIGLLQTGSFGYQGVTFNLGNTEGVGNPPGRIDTPLATDPRIREAFSLAVDRQALVNSVFNDWYEPACSFISPASTYATAAGEACPPHDPERARRLLTEAGVQLPYRIRVSASNTADTLRLSQALQASVLEAGFELEIEPVEYSTLLDQQSSGDFEAVQLGWSGRVDPHGNAASFLTTAAGNNYSGYSNPEVDALLQRAAQSTDPAVRAQLYGQVVTIVQRDNPIVYLYRVRSITGYVSSGEDAVAGVETYADGVVRLGRAAFVTEED
ncbi:ABC transporter substrate-binding protein [Kineococcus sp. T13]|uniref:ABC transporter substrate-binding protein n=1 Tax=Kineococcus vitellinus TaxID=2696565 RepID=UPI0014127320|nr:ABC transporter substrate-binding protein [Kineococcus vitellinus]NAZ74804.1 ABC transporter substrate-binding protein [Kineococcus vitellinus]